MSADTLKIWQETVIITWGHELCPYYTFLIFVLLGQHFHCSPLISSPDPLPSFISHNGHWSPLVVLVAGLQMHSLKWALIRSRQSSSILLALSFLSSPSALILSLTSWDCPEAEELDMEEEVRRRTGLKTTTLTYTMWQTRPEKQPCLKIHG